MITKRYGMGNLTEGELAAAGIGASLPVLMFGGLFLYILFSGSAATERKQALAKAKTDYTDRVAKIKKEYPRVRL